MDNGVRWMPLAFEGCQLGAEIREAVIGFAPHIVYENGVRSRAQRAALEVMALTGARLAMQSEDDDVQIYETHHGKAAAERLTIVDKPVLSSNDVIRFLRLNSWELSLRVLSNPEHNRWLEPLSRALCYRLAELHTVVWHPFGERLAREYGADPLVVPPVAAAADFERPMPSPGERVQVLQRYGIGHERVVIFIGGALYSFSDEYARFLEALNHTLALSDRPFALVIATGRSPLPVAGMAGEILHPSIQFADIGFADDDVYMEMLKASDVVCSPGLPDTFNRFRLPSRLVKAMAMAKPVLTCRCGFGESLEHGVNAFLMDGADPAQWAEAIAPCLNAEDRRRVGEGGRAFAMRHFRSDAVAAALKDKFVEMLLEPPRSLTDGMDFGSTKPSRPANNHYPVDQ
jgi:capsular polysaccharide export protein